MVNRWPKVVKKWSENGQKWSRNGQCCPKMARHGRKMAKSGQTMAQNGQRWPKITQNGQKMAGLSAMPYISRGRMPGSQGGARHPQERTTEGTTGEKARRPRFPRSFRAPPVGDSLEHLAPRLRSTRQVSSTRGARATVPERRHTAQAHHTHTPGGSARVMRRASAVTSTVRHACNVAMLKALLLLLVLYTAAAETHLHPAA